MKYVTVIYEVVNQAEWRAVNPLNYRHNGLRAVGASVGDLMEHSQALEELCDNNGIERPRITEQEGLHE